MTLEQLETLEEYLVEKLQFIQTDPDDETSWSWVCSGKREHTDAFLTQHKLPASVIHWQACCDCEVYFNMPD